MNLNGLKCQFPFIQKYGLIRQPNNPNWLIGEENEFPDLFPRKPTKPAEFFYYHQNFHKTQNFFSKGAAGCASLQSKGGYPGGDTFGSESYFDEPFYNDLNIGGYEPGPPPSDMPGESQSVNVSVYWGVHDIESEFKRLLKLGTAKFEKPTNVGDPIMVAMVKDPWGNAIGWINNPTFKLVS